MEFIDELIELREHLTTKIDAYDKKLRTLRGSIPADSVVEFTEWSDKVAKAMAERNDLKGELVELESEGESAARARVEFFEEEYKTRIMNFFLIRRMGDGSAWLGYRGKDGIEFSNNRAALHYCTLSGALRAAKTAASPWNSVEVWAHVDGTLEHDTNCDVKYPLAGKRRLAIVWG